MENKNADTIELIRAHQTNVQRSLGNKKIVTFRVGDLTIDNGVYYDGVKLEKRALRRVLSALRVRPDFINLAARMTPDDWSNVRDKIKGAVGGQVLYGKTFLDVDGANRKIVDVYFHNEKAKEPDVIPIDTYYNLICGALEQTDKRYDLSLTGFSRDREEVELVITEHDNPTNILPDIDGEDELWRLGHVFTFGFLDYNQMPWGERLICDNGARFRHESFRANIQNSKHNSIRIQQEILNALVNDRSSYVQVLRGKASAAMAYNASVSEYLAFRKLFEDMNNDGQMTAGIDRHLPDEHLFRGYGADINKKSPKWKATADSGVNAYDLFNKITWIASHINESGMPIEPHYQRMRIQQAATEFLTKETLDLADIAPPMKLEANFHNGDPR